MYPNIRDVIIEYTSTSRNNTVQKVWSDLNNKVRAFITLLPEHTPLILLNGPLSRISIALRYFTAYPWKYTLPVAFGRNPLLCTLMIGLKSGANLFTRGIKQFWMLSTDLLNINIYEGTDQYGHS